VSTKCRMQQCVTLSVTEAEYVSATECAQDMLYSMRILELIGLKVKKPMTLEVDNKGAVDLAIGVREVEQGMSMSDTTSYGSSKKKIYCRCDGSPPRR